VFEELESGADTLFIVKMPITYAEKASRPEDHCASSFGAAAPLREADRDHLLLDMVQLRFGHEAARKTVHHTREPHHPVGSASFLQAEGSFSKAANHDRIDP
jgi:hypothetical protein